MKTTRLSTLLLVTIVFPSAAHAVDIETVPISNAGNAGDVQLRGTFGAVDHNYRIGKFEVTNIQYAEFLNGVDPTGANPLALYNRNMAGSETGIPGGIGFDSGAIDGSKYEVTPDFDNKPVNYVSWYDAIRFANWLHNGQGSGSTETGAYTLLGGTPEPSNGLSITRNAGADWFLTSEDEWYKAAYHKNDGGTGNYWDYPTSSDTEPTAEPPPGGANSANFGGLAAGTITDVGAYVRAGSPYGTFDQGGNVWEWNEALIASVARGLRGAGWRNFLSDDVASSIRAALPPSRESDSLGFRVARSIPEPITGPRGVGCMSWHRRPIRCCPRRAGLLPAVRISTCHDMGS